MERKARAVLDGDPAGFPARRGRAHPDGRGNGYVRLDRWRVPNVGVLGNDGVAMLRDDDCRVFERDVTDAYSLVVVVPT